MSPTQKHSPASMFTFLQSLLVLSRPPLKCAINVKVFRVPSTAEQMRIPFARVNHAKYMVTDRVVYIGTSNWSENYFTQTAGAGVVVNQTGSVVKGDQRTLQSEAQEIFLKDWSSEPPRAEGSVGEVSGTSQSASSPVAASSTEGDSSVSDQGSTATVSSPPADSTSSTLDTQTKENVDEREVEDEDGEPNAAELRRRRLRKLETATSSSSSPPPPDN